MIVHNFVGISVKAFLRSPTRINNEKAAFSGLRREVKNFSDVRASFLLGIYLIQTRDRDSTKKRHLGKAF